LEAAKAGVSKTRIMFLANLSYKLLEKYLQTTINLGFIQFDGSNYRLTETGIQFLEKYDCFKNRYSKAQRHLENLAIERELLSQLCGKGKVSIPSRSADFGKGES
jgi:predicted transcriptional regulator